MSAPRAPIGERPPACSAEARARTGGGQPQKLLLHHPASLHQQHSDQTVPGPLRTLRRTSPGQAPRCKPRCGAQRHRAVGAMFCCSLLAEDGSNSLHWWRPEPPHVSGRVRVADPGRWHSAPLWGLKQSGHDCDQFERGGGRAGVCNFQELSRARGSVMARSIVS